MSKRRHSLIQLLQTACFWGFCLLLNMANVLAQTDRSEVGFPSDVQSSVPPTTGASSIDNVPVLLQPPPLKDRPPIPAPPAVTLPNLPGSDTPKPNLSWRAKAYTLANEQPSSASGDRMAWSLPVSYDKGLQLLTSALNQMGFQLLGAYQDAGQFFAKLRGEEGDTQIIIVVQPVNGSLTAFQLRILPEGHHYNRRRIEDLPKVMNTILGNRGVL